MDQYKTEEVGKNCLIKARNYAQVDNWARAFPHYLMCLEIFPNDRNKYIEEFTEVLHQLGVWLESKTQFSEVVKWYTTGLTYFPGNSRILNNFGEFLLRAEQPDQALIYLKSACASDSSSLLAEKNLLTAKLNVIPRWHFRMMNDRQRNEAYRSAIHGAITPEHNKVLDIGAGCGLLSFYASECKDAQSIVAIESSKTLSAIATSALKNCNIKVINKNSTCLSGLEIGLSNLLITEIFDAGLFGEHALKTLIHAWDNLLEPSAKIVPNSADLFITGLNSRIILSRHKLCSVIPHLGLKDLCVTQRTTEPYEAENLKEKVKYITNTMKLLSVDFTDVKQLRKIYKEANCIPVFTLTCQTAGTIDAFAVWFDLHLDDRISITTNPLKDNVTCWEQAIIYLDHPISVQQWQEIKIQISCVSNKLKATILDPIPTCDRCFKISPEMITFINDAHIIEAARDLELPNRYKETVSQILDLNPFPLFALCLAKKNYPGQYKFVVKDSGDFEFLNYIWCCNGFSPFNKPNSSSQTTFEIYKSWLSDNHLTQQSFDVIFVNPISNNGTLCEETFQKLPKLSNALKEDGLMFPAFVRLEAEIIDSNYLDFCTKVDDANLFGFAVANEINEYAVLEQWEVEPQYYNRKTLCNFASRTIDLRTHYEAPFVDTNMHLPITGTANGILYWYTLVYSKNVFINTYKSFHYNGACFVFKKPRAVNSGDVLCVNIRHENGLLKIYCDDEESEHSIIQKL